MERPQQPQQQPDERGIILGINGGYDSTTCVCMRFVPHHNPAGDIPIIGRAVSDGSDHIRVGENEAKNTLVKVLLEAMLRSMSTLDDVRAVCVAVSGYNQQSDQAMVYGWLREIFLTRVKLYVRSDAVPALCSGTMGIFSGCVLISGIGTVYYGCTEDGREFHAGVARGRLGDWGSGYGICYQGLDAVARADEGHGRPTMLTSKIVEAVPNSSASNIREWMYEDQPRNVATLVVPVVVSCAEAGDEVAREILAFSVEHLSDCIKAVIRTLKLCGEDRASPCPVVLVGRILEATYEIWDPAKEVMKRVNQEYPAAYPIRPQVDPAVGAALLGARLLRQGSLQ